MDMKELNAKLNRGLVNIQTLLKSRFANVSAMTLVEKTVYSLIFLGFLLAFFAIILMILGM